MEIGKTIIILTQKLSNIIDFDNIIFMEKGKIIEQGTHKELMNIKGKYLEILLMVCYTFTDYLADYFFIYNR